MSDEGMNWKKVIKLLKQDAASHRLSADYDAQAGRYKSASYKRALAEIARQAARTIEIYLHLQGNETKND